MNTTYDSQKTADYSPFIVHFTKDRDFVRQELVDEGNPLYHFRNKNAYERLLNILTEKTIYASPMPYLPNAPSAACFSECIWQGLVKLSQKYSPYGLVFNKRLVFEKNGGPALYIRGDSLKHMGENIPPEIEAMISPFDPTAVLSKGNVLEGLHEREWRLPSNLEFEAKDLEYLIVESLEDAQKIVEACGTINIPRDKIIVMDVYNTINQAWGSS